MTIADGFDAILVAGFPRSGTSLVMRMLGVAGVPLAYDHKRSFELDLMTMLPVAGATWLNRVRGTATKALDPLYAAPPPARYIALLMQRDPAEQARSYQRFMGELSGIRVSRSERAALERSFRSDFPKMVSLLQRVGAERLVRVSFEELIQVTERTARTIAEAVGLQPDEETLDAMCRCVVPRSPAAWSGPNLLEVDLPDEPVPVRTRAQEALPA